MNAVITKKQKNQIMMLGATAGLFGLIAGSVGLYLRSELTTGDNWEEKWIPEFTNGYMGVMSGFSVSTTLGYEQQLSLQMGTLRPTTQNS